MSIKENVEAIKSELNSEEKLFENVVRFEYLYKKYKFVLWAILFVAVVWLVASMVASSQNESRIASANAAFNTLMIEGEDTAALETLKQESRPLYELYLFQQAVAQSDIKALEELTRAKAFGIADMATYQWAVLSGDDKKLAHYAKNGIYFKELAVLQEAATLLKQSETKKAHALLETIGQQSPFYSQALALKHYGIVK